MAALGHRVTVRLPYSSDETVRRGVRWLGMDAPQQRYEVLFRVDCYEGRDSGLRTGLVACRSDPPVHTDFDQLIFLSRTHARLMGHPNRPYVGGGVDLANYSVRPRSPRLVICTSSPDRCPAAPAIGRGFAFVQTYRPIGSVGKELSRAELISLQEEARVQIHPCDPRRPSEFFCMSVLEAMAAGTPCVISDADALPELWGDAAIVLPRPIRIAQWVEEIERLMRDRAWWNRWSGAGRAKAQSYDWSLVAQRYLDAMES